MTQHEYDAVTNFRDLGGNLIFLSANNFFWKITISNHVMTRVAKWRDLGRPEAGLIGVEYFHNDMGEHRGPWVVRPAAKQLPWLIDGTGLDVGMKFSSGGIEADDVTADSPKERSRDRCDPESLRRRAQRRHDVLRHAGGSEGVRSRRLLDRRLGLAGARSRVGDQPVELDGEGLNVGSPVVSTTSLWLKEPHDGLPRSRSEGRAEVVVIGGGVTGCSCALTLAEHGVRVRLYEAREIAGGASGRNGGFALRGAAVPYDEARRELGDERARQLMELTERSLDRMEELAGDAFRRVGSLRLAFDRDETRRAAARTRRAA